MGSYELVARDDALWIANFLAETFPLIDAREWYEGMSKEVLVDFERRNQSLISAFIGKSASQRGALFRKMGKEAKDKTKVVFLTLAMLAAIRVQKTIELRDRFRNVLAPGSGNRITIEALYDFGYEVKAVFDDFAWPCDLFEELDLDDGGYDDETTAETPVEDSFQPSPPAIPEREIVVYVGPSNLFTTDGSRIVRRVDTSLNQLWRVTGQDLVNERAFVRLFPAKPDKDAILACCTSLLGYEVPSHLVVLVVPKAIREQAPALASGIAPFDRPLYLVRQGVANSLPARWVDEYLADLERELALIGEPMVSIEEFPNGLDSLGNLVVIDPAEPIERRLPRRAALAVHVRAIAALRGRNLQDFPVPGPVMPGSFQTFTEPLTKELAKLEKYDREERLSDLGAFLFDVAESAMQWRHNPIDLQAAEHIGNAVVRRMAGTWLGQSHTLRLWLEVDSVVGHASQEIDLFERAVIARLSRPIPKAWLFRAQPSVTFGGVPPQSPPDPGFVMAWWASLDVLEARGMGTLAWLPHEHRIASAMQSALSAVSVTALCVGSQLWEDERFGRPNGEQWLTAIRQWHSIAEELLKAIQTRNGYRSAVLKKHWFAERASSGRRRFIVITEHPDEASASDTQRGVRSLLRHVGTGVPCRHGFAKSSSNRDNGCSSSTFASSSRLTAFLGSPSERLSQMRAATLIGRADRTSKPTFGQNPQFWR